MTRVPSLCAVILAAGESSRMGRDKALLPWPPISNTLSAPAETFLSAAIRVLSSYNDMVYVVAGRNADLLSPVVFANGASLVVNPDPDRGQFSSLKLGLQEILGRGRDAAMVTLVDRPPVSPRSIQTLLDSFERALLQEKWAVIPEYEGKHGHPILLGREMIEAFLKAPGSATARDVEHAHRVRIEYVRVDDPLIVQNVNTPADYANLSALVAEGIGLN